VLASSHANYFCELAETAEPYLASSLRQIWLWKLDSDVANLRAALNWTSTSGDPCVGLRLLGALCWFWILKGQLREGSQWTDRLLARPIASCSVAARASALYVAAAFEWKWENQETARRYAEESVTLCRSDEDGRRLPFALAISGNIATSRGECHRARHLHDESLSLFRERDDRWGIAYALSNRGDALLKCGELAEAYSDYTESLAYFAAINDAWGQGIVLHTLGNTAWARADMETARACFGESVAIFRGMGNQENMARAMIGLAAVMLACENPEEAVLLLIESMTTWRDLGGRAGMALCLAGLAAVRAEQGAFLEAARWFGLAESQGNRPSLYVIDASLFTRSRQNAEAHLGAALFAEAWNEGRAMILEQVVDRILTAESP
jgi:tetratricopeptide (TPR) repeat protein